MIGVKQLTKAEVNAAFADVGRQLARLTGGAGPINLLGPVDLHGHVVSNSGKATRTQDLITKGAVEQQIIETTTTLINQSSSTVWVKMNQALSGTEDGANQTFTLPYTPFDNRVAIYHRHVRLERVNSLPGLRQYTLTGATVKMGEAPLAGDHLKADILVPRPVSPVFAERPSGAMNGSNTVFTLAYLPTAPSDVMVYVGGVLFVRVEASPAGDEYTFQGQTLTLGAAPLADDMFVVDYPVAVPGNIRWGDELAGTKNGVNTVFTLDEAPVGDEIGIYQAHIRLKEVAVPTLPTEYSIVGRTVTLGMAPSATDPLFAHYAIPSGGDILHAGPGWRIGTEHGDAYATTLADHFVLAPEGLNGFMGGQN